MDLTSRPYRSTDCRVTLTGYSLREVSALVLVGGRPDTERFNETPLALLDVLGRSILMRTLDRLRVAGIGEIAVVSDSDVLPSHTASVSCKFSVTSPERLWEEALHQFRRLARHSESVLVIRLGAWVELDFAAMVSEHRCLGGVLTRVCSQRGEALDVFAISSCSQSEAAALLRGELRDERISAVPYLCQGYINLLDAPECLRTLILDAFAGESEIRPCGCEIRPGVWAGKGVQIHSHARIVAPAYIGDFCNVRRAAVITRGSSLEHHSEIDCASVVENSSILPYTRVGAGLDVEYSVAGSQHVHSIRRDATVEINDPRLIGTTEPQLSARLLAAGNWVLYSLPAVLWKLLFERSVPESAQGIASDVLGHNEATLGDPSLAPVETQTKAYGDIAARRRYGSE